MKIQKSRGSGHTYACVGAWVQRRPVCISGAAGDAKADRPGEAREAKC